MKLTVINTTSFTNQITTYFSCGWSSDENIYVITDDIVYILKLIPNVSSRTNLFEFTSSEIKLSTYNIIDNLGYDFSNILNNLPRECFYSAIFNSNLTPHLNNINDAALLPVAAQWSAYGIHNNDSNMIAIVSSTGNVEIYACYKSHDETKWQMLLNLTECWVELCKRNWEKIKENTTVEVKFKIVKERVQRCFATCVAWSDIISEFIDRYCYVCVGYANGFIAIWKIPELTTSLDRKEWENLKLETRCVYSTKVSFDRITALHWCIYNKTVLLAVGDKQGILKLYPIVSPDFRVFIVDLPITLWNENDVRVSKILTLNYDSSLLIIAAKGPHVLLFILKLPRKIVARKYINIGNLSVTEMIYIGKGRFMVSTHMGNMKIIKLLVRKQNKIVVQLIEVKSDKNMDMLSIRGLMVSPRYLLWGILTYPRKWFDHLALRSPSEILFCYENGVNPADPLNKNITGCLNNYWECLEIIRCLSIKHNKSPLNWLVNKPSINFADISLYELRLLYWVTYMWHNISKDHIEEEQAEKITFNMNLFHKVIMLKFQMSRLNGLLMKHDSKDLVKLDMESVYFLFDSIQRIWSDKNISAAFNEKYDKLDDLMEKMSEVKLPDPPKCYFCDEDLTGEPCKNNDDQRCLITLLQTEMESIGWICTVCRKIAHVVVGERELCPLCDIPLIKYVK